MEDVRRKMFFQSVSTSLWIMLIGAVLAYLGVVLWYWVGWFWGILGGGIGVLVFLIGAFEGATKSSTEMVRDAIYEALRTGSPKVHIQSIRLTMDELRPARVSDKLKKMREITLVWNPLYDRVVQLFAETIEGEVPSLRMGPDGKPLRNGSGNYVVEGGWPCQQYPEGWRERARKVLEDYQRERAKYLSHKEGRRIRTLVPLLQKSLDDPRQLSVGEIGAIRSILAGIAGQRGLPDSPRSQALRRAQETVARGATYEDMSRVLIARLENLRKSAGLDSTDGVLAPISATEALRFGLIAGQTIPEALAARVNRSLNVSLEELVERGDVSSIGLLRTVIPQLNSSIDLAALDGRAWDDLYTALKFAMARSRVNSAVCPRCGKLSRVGSFSCQSCNASLARLRRLWHAGMAVGIPGVGGIGIVLAVTLAGSGIGGGPPVAAALCDQERPRNEGSTFGSATDVRELCFEGTDDFIEITDTTGMDFRDGDFSIVLRVNFESLSTDQTLLHKVIGKTPEDQGYALQWLAAERSLRFLVREGDSNQYDLRRRAAIWAGRWHHVAAVRTGNTTSVYIDGRLIGRQAEGNGVDTGSGGVARIGQSVPDAGSGDWPFRGRMDDAAIFGRALASGEIGVMSGAFPPPTATASIPEAAPTAAPTATARPTPTPTALRTLPTATATPAPTQPATVAAARGVVTGEVLYNGEPLSGYTSVEAFFSLLIVGGATIDLSLIRKGALVGQDFTDLFADYDPATGAYRISGLPPGRFVFRVNFHAGDRGYGYAGDYEGVLTVTMPSETPTVSQDLSVTKAIHLIRPVDNAEPIGSTTATKESFASDELIFQWEPLAGASNYQLEIYKVQESSRSYGSEDLVATVETSEPRWKPILQPSKTGQFYLLTMNAWNSDGEVIGMLRVPYTNGSGSSYQFRVGQPAGSGQPSANLPPTPYTATSPPTPIVDTLEEATPITRFSTSGTGGQVISMGQLVGPASPLPS